MAVSEKIKCKTPSTGRVKNYTLNNVQTNTWTLLAEAPYFSVPDSRRLFTDRDPTDATRGLRPGEIFFMTPIFVRNTNYSNVPPGLTGITTTNDIAIIDVRYVLEDETIIRCPGLMSIPPGETAMVPVQGRSLVKRKFTLTRGDRLEIYVHNLSNISAPLQIWASAEEKPCSEHTGFEAT